MRNEFLLFVSHSVSGILLQQVQQTKIASHSKFYAQKRHDGSAAGRRLRGEPGVGRGWSVRVYCNNLDEV